MIIDETNRLKESALYGDIGIEAILAQLYPPEVSLFLDHMNVIEARKEASFLIRALEKYGVKVTQIRPLIADKIKRTSSFKLHAEEVLEGILAQVTALSAKAPQPYPLTFYIDQIRTLFQQDVEKYGLEIATKLNYHLSLSPQLPLGNMLFARDHMNIVGNTRIIANFKNEIRKKEAEIYQEIYGELFPKQRTIRLESDETFEGGDLFVHNQTIFIGVGPRTNMKAAKRIFSELQKDPAVKNFRFVIAQESNGKSKCHKEKMDYMHIDMWSYPIGNKQMMLVPEEAGNRNTVILVMQNEMVFEKNLNKSFLQFLEENDYEIIEITPEEQNDFGCNNLCLDENTLITPINGNHSVTNKLRKLGKNIITVNLKESTKGYGAAHCMTGQIERI